MRDIKRPLRNSKYNSLKPNGHNTTINPRSVTRTQQNYEEDYIDPVVKNTPVRPFAKPTKSHFYTRPSIKPIKKTKKLSFFQKTIIALFLAILAVFLLWTFVFNSAKVLVSSRVENIKPNNTIIFTNTDDNKTYDIVEITKTEQKDIPKSETRKIQSKAAGEITIYNNYTTSTQKLVKNTRFETKDGKVFRITDSVVIPGKTESGAGSVTVKVSADTFGDAYNIAPTTFTIPGFKNTPRYSTFYGQSTKAMYGGANGNANSMAKEDVDAANTELQAKLSESIKDELLAVKKDGYMSATTSIVFDTINNSAALLANKDTKFEISVTGKILLIKEAALAKVLAEKNIPDFKGENVYIKNKEDLNLTLAKDTILSLTKPISIDVYGDIDLEYKIEIDSIKKALIGQSSLQDNFNSIMNAFSGVKNATVRISPPWVNSFPKNPNKIEVIKNQNVTP